MANLERRLVQRRRRRIGVACAAAALVLLAAAIAVRRTEVSAALTGDNLRSSLDDVWVGWKVSALNGWYWLFVAVAIVLERLWPGREGEGILTPNGATDFVWVVLSPVWSLTVVALYLAVLNLVYQGVFGGFSFGLSAKVGTVAAFAIAFLVGDFTMWFTHLVRHKVPTFWYFHAVHHSQPRMNTMTDWRVHFAEPMIAATMVFIPAQLLGVGSSAAAALSFLTVYFTGFTHTNLHTNLGPLRWVLVSPQSHRVHHSFEPQHIDKNFGAILSIWDRLFRTQYWGEDEYPAVGITDQRFPLETTARPGAVLKAYWAQQWYPFGQMVRDVGKFRDLAGATASPGTASGGEAAAVPPATD